MIHPPDVQQPDAAGQGLLARWRHAQARVILARRALAPFLIAGIAVATISLVVVVALARQTPGWWRAVDARAPETVELAGAVERGVVNELHRGRVGEPAWTVAISPEQANAWLNTRMPRWLENRAIGWPAEVREVQCDFSGGLVRLGARVGAEGDAGQIVVASVAPTVEGGALWLRLVGARAGRLDLPSGWTIERLRAWLPETVRDRESTRRLLGALEGEGPFIADAAVELEDGRRVRLLEARVEGGRLLLTCVTEQSGVSTRRRASRRRPWRGAASTSGGPLRRGRRARR